MIPGLNEYLRAQEESDAVNDWVEEHGLAYYIAALQAGDTKVTEMSYADWCDEGDMTFEAYQENEGR